MLLKDIESRSDVKGMIRRVQKHEMLKQGVKKSTGIMIF